MRKERPLRQKTADGESDVLNPGLVQGIEHIDDAFVAGLRFGLKGHEHRLLLLRGRCRHPAQRAGQHGQGFVLGGIESLLVQRDRAVFENAEGDFLSGKPDDGT